MALIIRRVLRRVHTSRLTSGPIQLDKVDAHHVRNVLRLKAGDELELFDDAGSTALGRIARCDADALIVDVGEVRAPTESDELIIASAIPKGERADWMIEKLSELGVSRFVPLITARSVVDPGKNKLDRWRRIATESAKQSRRAGVIKIDEPSEISDVLRASGGTDIPVGVGSTYASSRDSDAGVPASDTDKNLCVTGIKSLYLDPMPAAISILDALKSTRDKSPARYSFSWTREME